MIYVDSGEGRKMIVRLHETPACRLFVDADTPLEELDAFAERLGLVPRYRRGCLHYDLSWGKRLEALRKGATAVTPKQAGAIFKRWEKKISVPKSEGA